MLMCQNISASLLRKVLYIRLLYFDISWKVKADLYYDIKERGKRIKELRKKKGISIEDIKRYIGEYLKLRK